MSEFELIRRSGPRQGPSQAQRFLDNHKERERKNQNDRGIQIRALRCHFIRIGDLREPESNNDSNIGTYHSTSMWLQELQVDEKDKSYNDVCRKLGRVKMSNIFKYCKMLST